MMKNPSLAALEGLMGDWRATVSEAAFLVDPTEVRTGRTSFSWLDDAFVVMRSEMPGGPPASTAVIGHSPESGYSMFSYDERGVSRIWAMTFEEGHWTLERAGQDFYQRYEGRVSGDRIEGSWQMSHDQGATWNHDFTLVYERA